MPCVLAVASLRTTPAAISVTAPSEADWPALRALPWISPPMLTRSASLWINTPPFMAATDAGSADDAMWMLPPWIVA
ncbi:hypothetical protein GO279_04928 [Ralstonia solanacearum]|nr:hypothetical protein [Ralstonia solanacearum]NKA56253.1 hypothetical protein [Ralstonia solanacearum]NKA86412.1 hypothetical protein [Ralstonia solanacearum]NKF62754.1 hypothetical protein [Ralstonia solanacearum]NKF67734.1 hypothetical protein [Ralstonia solanacearum]